MSAAEIHVGRAAVAGAPDEISRRLENLPASSHVWRLVILLSLGGCFEIYDLFLTGYIAPGLARSGLLTTTTQAFFGFSGIGAFVAATFAGLFAGTFFLGFLADRFGRRAIFTYALLGYSAASVAMACQTMADGRAAVAVHRRDRHRRRDHYHRRLHHRTGAELDPGVAPSRSTRR